MSSSNPNNGAESEQEDVAAKTEVFSDFAATRKSLHAQIADYLQDLIATKRINSGSKLPSERDLAQKFNVNRATIREAIKLLIQRGLIEVRTGLGVFVTQVASSVVTDSILRYLGFGNCTYDTLMELRFMLEPEIAALAAQRATEGDIEVLKNLSAQLIQSLDDDNYENTAKIDAEFHIALAEATHNELIIAIMKGLEESMSNWISRTAAFYHIPEGRESHYGIYEAVRTGNVESSREAMHTHMYYARRTIEQKSTG